MNFKSFPPKNSRSKMKTPSVHFCIVAAEMRRHWDISKQGHIKRNVPTKMYINMAIPSLESYQKRVEKVRVHVIDCVNVNTDLKIDKRFCFRSSAITPVSSLYEPLLWTIVVISVGHPAVELIVLPCKARQLIWKSLNNITNSSQQVLKPKPQAWKLELAWRCCRPVD